MKRLVLAAAVLGVMATLVMPSPAPAQTLPGTIDSTCAQARGLLGLSERALDAGQQFVDNESEQLVDDRTLAALLDRALQPEVRLVVDQATREVVAARRTTFRTDCRARVFMKIIDHLTP